MSGFCFFNDLICRFSFSDRVGEIRQSIMATADAACQTLMTHISSLRMEDALNKIFDQGIRSNMRLQDLRTRVKDLQDDMRMVKRQLLIEDEKKSIRFALDPTEGQPKDYCQHDEDRTTRKLGSSFSSLEDPCLEGKRGGSSNGENGVSRVKRLKLWTSSDADKKEDLEKAQGSKPEGQINKEKILGKDEASKPEGLDGRWQVTRPDDAADSSLEEDNTDPESPQKTYKTWIIFEGETTPVCTEQMSIEHENMLENGKKYRFVDIEDSFFLKKKIAENQAEDSSCLKKRIAEKEAKAKEMKDDQIQIAEKDEKPILQIAEKEAKAKEMKKDQTQIAEENEKYFVLQVEVDEEKMKRDMKKSVPRKIKPLKEKQRLPPGNPFDERGRLIKTLD